MRVPILATRPPKSWLDGHGHMMLAEPFPVMSAIGQCPKVLSCERFRMPGRAHGLRSSGTSSVPSTTGSRSGIGIRAMRSPKPVRPSVTRKKKRSAVQAWFIRA